MLSVVRVIRKSDRFNLFLHFAADILEVVCFLWCMLHAILVSTFDNLP